MSSNELNESEIKKFYYHSTKKIFVVTLLDETIAKYPSDHPLLKKLKRQKVREYNQHRQKLKKEENPLNNIISEPRKRKQINYKEETTKRFFGLVYNETKRKKRKQRVLDDDITYQLHAPRRKLQNGFRNLEGGRIVFLKDNTVEYECRYYTKNMTKAETIRHIVRKVKHKYHQDKMRESGFVLEVTLLTSEIMILFNKKWFEWCRLDNITRDRKIEGGSILRIPTDHLIRQEMTAPGGILQGIESNMTQLQKKILTSILENREGMFRFPAVNYIQLRHDKTEYLTITGGEENQLCVNEMWEKINEYKTKPIQFVRDVFKIFDNCIKYHTFLLTKEEEVRNIQDNRNIIKCAYRLKIKCYNRFVNGIQLPHSNLVKEQFLTIHTNDKVQKQKIQEEDARRKRESRKTYEKRGRPKKSC